MSDTEAAPAAPERENPPKPFESLAALRLAHQDMLERQAGSDTAPPQNIPSVEAAAYIDRAGATGAILDDPEDRRTVQRILDYWSADLVAASRQTRAEVRPAQLAPYAPRTSAAGAEGGGAVQTPEDARQYIRLSALARQWQDSGAPGYLLTGGALKEAERFERDPDVAALLHASREAQRSTERRRQWFKNALMALMAVVIIALAGLIMVAKNETKIAFEAKGNAEAALDDVKQHQDELAAALAKSQKLQAELTESNKAAVERLKDLGTIEDLLNEALNILADQVKHDQLDLGSIVSDGLRRRLRERLEHTVRNERSEPFNRVTATAPPAASEDQPPAEDTASPSAAVNPPEAALQIAAADRALRLQNSEELYAGYDAGFLGIELPLPALTAQQVRTAYQGGAPIPYYNFSLVLDEQRRLPLLSAANLDRARTRALPRVEYRFRSDRRIPAAAQPDLLFPSRGVVWTPLVETRDIAWGDALPEDPVEAAGVVTQAITLAPNFAPQNADMFRHAWNPVTEWVRLQHNPGASRVTIFSGPVFGSDRSGEALPVAFWKIAVSTQPGLSKDPASAPLVVDAFLVPNDTSPALAPERYRVTVDEITVRTGLRFPPALAEATRRGERLAARLPDLDSQNADVRQRLVQDLVDLLRSPTAAAADKQRVCEALLQMADGAAVGALSPAGRVNLFHVLAQIPAATWDRGPWLPLKAQARRAVAGLQVEMGPQARGNLAVLRERLGLADPFAQTVYVQFAGFTRESVVALSQSLKALGWRVPGEERVDSARGLNQVRYHQGATEDEAAARLLAADLRAAGQPDVTAVAMEVIRPGILEVWISR